MCLGPWVLAVTRDVASPVGRSDQSGMIYGKYYGQVLECERDRRLDQESNNFFAEFPTDTATVYTVCGLGWLRGRGLFHRCSHIWMSLGN
jgi:hypothetical protein